MFEDLTDIRERLPHTAWYHVWAFRRLSEYVEYKAPERSIDVTQIAPDHTSQRCSRTGCGFVHKDNHDGEHFHCQKCGLRRHCGLQRGRRMTSGGQPESKGFW